MLNWGRPESASPDSCPGGSRSWSGDRRGRAVQRARPRRLPLVAVSREAWSALIPDSALRLLSWVISGSLDAARITGADSPVIADSSTTAMPSLPCA